MLELARAGGKTQDFAVLLRNAAMPNVVHKISKMAKRPRARAT